MNDDFLRLSVIFSYFRLSISPFRVTKNIRNNAKQRSETMVKEEIMETKEMFEKSLNLKSYRLIKLQRSIGLNYEKIRLIVRLHINSFCNRTFRGSMLVQNLDKIFNNNKMNQLERYRQI
jgi:hypothetical protein